MISGSVVHTLTMSTYPTSTDEQLRLSMQVLRQFRMVFGEVRQHFQDVERQVGIGGAQLWALSEIAREPGLGVTDLALQMDIHQSTASNLVRHLLQKGLVVSQRSEHDRRNVVLSPTASGHALLASAPGPHEGVLPGALQRLSPEALQQLHAHLSQLLQQLQPDQRTARLPLAEL
jgi:DNA-binding MarR family transcriptional regulator